MVVDRLGIAMLAVGAVGVVWLAWPAPDVERIRRCADCGPVPMAASIQGDKDCPGIRLPQPVCSTDGGTPEPMQGPFDSLGAAAGSGELDVKTMRGVAPFDELTVLHAGDGTPDLSSHDRLVLVIRVGAWWYTRELASIGPFCGGMGSPTWVDAEASAPRIVDGAVSVRTHETFRQGDSERSSDSLVECRLNP